MLTRRLSLLLSGLVCSSFAHAGEGFYVGAGAGYSHSSYQYKSETSTATAGTIEFEPVADFGPEENTFVGEVSAGYQWLFLNQRLITSFALEAFADFKSADFENSTHYAKTDTTYTSKSRSGNTYGISLKPGLFLSNNFLLYGDIGAAYTTIKDITTNFNDPGLFESNSEGSFDNQNLWGLRVGAGIQWLFTKQFSLDLSWARDIYSKNIEDERLLLLSTGGEVNEHIKITDFEEDIFLLGFNYYFDT